VAATLTKRLAATWLATNGLVVSWVCPSLALVLVNPVAARPVRLLGHGIDLSALIRACRDPSGRASADQPGLLGALTARAEAQVIRLALLFALLDKEGSIGVAHLKAALAFWRYCEASNLPAPANIRPLGSRPKSRELPRVEPKLLECAEPGPQRRQGFRPSGRRDG
jgi:hypothetical protein